MARKIDRRKLEALLTPEAASSPAERTMAQRILAGMDAGATQDALIIAVRESWEVALLEFLAERHQVASSGQGGFIKIEGDSTAINTLIGELVQLHPKLEAAVTSAAAGFLAVHFPPQRGCTSNKTEDSVQAASRRAAKATMQEAPPKQLESREVHLLTLKQ